MLVTTSLIVSSTWGGRLKIKKDKSFVGINCFLDIWGIEILYSCDIAHDLFDAAASLFK